MCLSPCAFADPPKFSADLSTYKEIRQDPQAKAAFDRVFPELANNPQLDAVESATLGDIAAHVPDRMTLEKLTALQAEFDKIK